MLKIKKKDHYTQFISILKKVHVFGQWPVKKIYNTGQHDY